MRSSLLVAFVLGLLAQGTAPAPASARGWLRPVEGAVLRPFAVGPDRFAAGQHRGVDLAAAPGARVLAACGGRVSFAGRVPRGGRTVSVRCGTLVATYQHLGSVAVARGQLVRAGGRIGRAGHARPVPHVHLGARSAATGEYRDPLALFAGAPRGPLAPVPGRRRAPPGSPDPGAPPLGPAPAPARARAPSPAPAPAPAPAPSRSPRVELPDARRAGQARAPAPRLAPGPLPWPVWLGLALVALGLPLGGGLVVARRRQRFEPRPGHAAPHR